MSESKHTEGPWAWANGNSKTHKELYPSQFNLGEEDSILYHGADWGMKKADTNLIAAAPELLESLKEVFNLLEEELPNWYLRGHYNHMKAAIAKAEGK